MCFDFYAAKYFRNAVLGLRSRCPNRETVGTIIIKNFVKIVRTKNENAYLMAACASDILPYQSLVFSRKILFSCESEHLNQTNLIESNRDFNDTR